MMIEFKKNGVELNNQKWGLLKKEITIEIERITRKLEKFFGPVSKGYSLSLNFIPGKAPITIVKNSLMKITINLPDYEMNSEENSRFQRSLNLAHELVHTLTPNEKSNEVTVFEEGLATYFSEEYTNIEESVPQKMYDYANARNLVRQLLQMDKDIVKKLRKSHPSKNISEFTVDDLVGELGPKATNLAQSLAKPFYNKP